MDIYEKLLKCASVLVMLCSIFSAAARNFIHPGLLHSQDDLKTYYSTCEREFLSGYGFV
mgnify:CR=1 FL=1